MVLVGRAAAVLGGVAVGVELPVGAGQPHVHLAPRLGGQVHLGVVGAEVGVTAAAPIPWGVGRGVNESVVGGHPLLADAREEAAAAAVVIAMPA